MTQLRLLPRILGIKVFVTLRVNINRARQMGARLRTQLAGRRHADGRLRSLVGALVNRHMTTSKGAVTIGRRMFPFVAVHAIVNI